MKKHLLISFFVLTLSSCGLGPEKSNEKGLYAVDSSKVSDFVRLTTHGKVLFKQHCLNCHTTPDNDAKCSQIFDRIFERLPNPSELYFAKYIQDSKAVKLSGDSYAKKIDSNYNSPYEHYFVDSLTNEDIRDLIIFIKSTYY